MRAVSQYVKSGTPSFRYSIRYPPRRREKGGEGEIESFFLQQYSARTHTRFMAKKRGRVVVGFSPRHAVLTQHTILWSLPLRAQFARLAQSNQNVFNTQDNKKKERSDSECTSLWFLRGTPEHTLKVLYKNELFGARSRLMRPQRSECAD